MFGAGLDPPRREIQPYDHSSLSLLPWFPESFMECLVTALASPLPCADPRLGTNWLTGWKVMGRTDEVIVFASVSAFPKRIFTARESVFLELVCSVSML